MNAKRPSRDTNWGYAEKCILLEEVTKCASIIENKNMDVKSNNRKNEVWENISKTLLVNGYSRNAKRVKDQWRRMKLAAKSNIAQYNKYKRGTGGGPLKKCPDDVDYAIQALLPMDFEEDSSKFDSDKETDATQEKRKKMSEYEERCLELYEKKIKLQIKQQRELHNIRKRWEEKIYKLKYNLLKINGNSDTE